MTCLEDLNLDGCFVNKLDGMSNPKLKRVSLNETGVSWLHPLANMPQLQYLSVSKSAVMSLEPLSGLTNLRELHCELVSVDFSFLSNHKYLHTLVMPWTVLDDIGFLATLENLEVVDVSNTKVSDLTPLAGSKKLRRLNISGTDVLCLDPVGGLVGEELTVTEGVFESTSFRGDFPRVKLVPSCTG
ncbi:hypothetical protein HDU98_010784, partial [Podochytrium sp. JEL0797]